MTFNRLFLIIPCSKEIATKWARYKTLGGFSEDDVFLDNLISAYDSLMNLCPDDDDVKYELPNDVDSLLTGKLSITADADERSFPKGFIEISRKNKFEIHVAKDVKATRKSLRSRPIKIETNFDVREEDRNLRHRKHSRRKKEKRKSGPILRVNGSAKFFPSDGLEDYGDVQAFLDTSSGQYDEQDNMDCDQNKDFNFIEDSAIFSDTSAPSTEESSRKRKRARSTDTGSAKHSSSCHQSYDCQQCGRQFTNLKLVREHMATHTRSDVHRCAYCGKLFYSRLNFEQHLDIHIKRGDELDVALACLVGPQEPDPPENEETPEGDSNNSGGLDSKKNRRLKLAKLCHVCGKVCRDAVVLFHHFATHKPVKSEKVECRICGQFYASMKSLRTHKSQYHEKGRKFVCDQCGKGFMSGGALRKHTYVHTGEKPYACSYCPKRFTCPYNLQQHENVHSGVKKYECEFCHETFAQVSALCQHKRKHTGYKVTEKRNMEIANYAMKNTDLAVSN